MPHVNQNQKTSAIPMAYATAVLPIPVNPTSQQGSTSSTTRPTGTLLNEGRSKQVQVPQTSSNVPNFHQDTVAALKDQGYTSGLIQSIIRSNTTFPLRIWIVDNSGSMMAGDGHRIVESGNSNNRLVRFVNCTRWAEIKETVQYHARIAALLEAPTVFRLLNDPGRMAGAQQFSIAERGAEFIAEDLDIALSTIQRVSPSGVTPLSEHLEEIRLNVVQMSKDLFQNGQKVVVVIATDGLPTNRSGMSGPVELAMFKRALRSLEGLPVWIVVRLCTDEDNVVEFYNDLDSELELSLEVLDDFKGEALEVCGCNTWLNYGLPLHRIREMGFSHKLFDLLDERRLTKDELREFFLFIFGSDLMDGVPDPQVDWQRFVSRIGSIVNRETSQWNPIGQKMMPWVNIKKLDSTYGNGDSCEACTIM